MYPLLFSTFMTGVIFLLDARAKCKQPFYKYLAIFFLLSGINFLFSSTQAQAQQLDMFKQTFLTYDVLTRQIILNGEDNTIAGKQEKKSAREINKDYMYFCKEKMDYHFEEGMKCFKEAQEACLLLPHIDDREKAQLCFQNFIITLAPASPKYRVVAALISMLGQYGFAVMGEWNRIDMRLQQAKYHWEMEEHYRTTGKYVQNQLNAEKK